MEPRSIFAKSAPPREVYHCARICICGQRIEADGYSPAEAKKHGDAKWELHQYECPTLKEAR